MLKEKRKKQLKSFDAIRINLSNPYFIINLTFAGILLLMLIYSGIFSAQGLAHPLKSATIEPSISTGLSRAFSEIVRLNFTEALQFNPYSISIFLFFFIQLILRILFLGLLLSTHISGKLLVIADVLTSVLLFLFTFSSFIFNQF